MKKPPANWNNTSRKPEGINTETEDRRQKTGNRRPGNENRRPETGDWRMKTGEPYIYQVRIYANR